MSPDRFIRLALAAAMLAALAPAVAAEDAARARKAERVPQTMPDGRERDRPLPQPIISNQAITTSPPVREIPVTPPPGRRQPLQNGVTTFESKPIPEYRPEPIIRPN